jgi:hypothetical protein
VTKATAQEDLKPNGFWLMLLRFVSASHSGLDSGCDEPGYFMTKKLTSLVIAMILWTTGGIFIGNNHYWLSVAIIAVGWIVTIVGGVFGE